MTVALVAVGDELLNGDVPNGNAVQLARRLAGAGTEVVGADVVPDDEPAIVAALREALRRADTVIVTGGLGPTPDDLTREALAALAGVRLIRHERIRDALADRAARLGRRLTAGEERQADVPAGARPLPNPVGTAPGLRLEVDGRVMYALPGVPAEMAAIVEQSVLPELAGRARPAACRVLRTIGRAEADVAAALADVATPSGGRLAYLAADGEVRVRLSVRGADPPAVLAGWEDAARAALGDAVYGADDDTLPGVVHRLLAAAGATVAGAESLTGGLLGALLAEPPGASAAYRGTVVAYATELKAALLGVPADLLAERGPVDGDVAAAMATGARSRLGAAYAIALTGVAGPTEQGGQPPGTVYVAVAGPAGVEVTRLRLAGERTQVRRRAALAGLDALRRTLLRREAAELREC